MALKFGHRKMGLTPAQWATRNTIFTKTAGGKFGHRKTGGTITQPDPALSHASEKLPPPPEHKIGLLPTAAAIEAVRNEVGPLGSLLTSELTDRAGRGPRKTVLQSLRDLGEARGDSAVVESANEALAALAKKAETE